MIASSIRDNNIREAIRLLKAKDLIVQENGIYSPTALGKKIATYGKLELKHEIYWLSRILTEKMVLIVSLTILIVLAVLKISFGLTTRSNGLFSDGIENFTDLIKIGIIVLSIRYAKDRLGSIGIMIMMIYAGIILCYTSIASLIKTPFISAGSINGIGFFIAVLSLALNAILLKYKFFVGKRTGNLSILSDAKDSAHNMQIAAGVLIGLVFAIFGVYMVDVVVGLVIGILILWDGGATLKELLVKGEDIDVNAIHLGSDNKYIDRITHWIITVVEGEELTRAELNIRFLEGLDVGYKYFDEWAVIGYHQLQERGIHDKIEYLIKNDIIREENGKLYLTRKGYIQFYQLQSKDLKRLAKSINEKRRRRMKMIKRLIVLAIMGGITGLLLYIYL
jgi:Co/Zn/Cd efflux system component